MTGKLRSVLKFFGWCAAMCAAMLFAGAVAAAVLYERYSDRAAKFDLSRLDAVPERSAIYDSHGEHYGYFGGENRIVVPLSAVSKHFLNALIAREDSRFWQHDGVDWRSVLRAAFVNLRAGETRQGASTITQQLARNAFQLRERTLDRKALEAALASRIEKIYTKEQILELYVNRVYFGSTYQGIETAARGYFGKSAADLTLAEGATLAALIRNPRRLSPRNQFEAAWEARNEVIDRMLAVRLISEDDALAAKAQQIKLAQTNLTRVTDDDVTDAVVQELETLLTPESIQFGGLKVFMTIDPQLQHQAQAAVDRRVTEIEEAKGFPHPRKRDFVPSPGSESDDKRTDYLQAAVVAIDNRTGAIRAAVGGRDYRQSKFSRALQGKRQIGSTFKPFVYAAAFERGLQPGTLIDDSQIRAGEFRDIPKNWSPENSDDEYGGPTPAAAGLLKSRNTMTVRVGEQAGLPKVCELAQSAGISNSIPNLPVVFLGGFEATVKDLAAAFAIFPNLGIWRQPFLISSIEDRDGHVLWRAPSEEKRVISSDTAWMTSSILQEVMKTGTAAKAKSLGWKKIGAGKTGTTNEFHDAWFVGYTSSLTCAVWVGLDQPKTITSKGYGSTLALPVWVDFMQQVPEKEFPAAPFEPSTPSVKVTLCSVSGARATSACVAQGCAYEASLPASRVPALNCPTHPEPATLPQPVAEPVVSRATPYPAPVATTPATPPPTRGLTPDPIPPPIAEYAPDEVKSATIEGDRALISSQNNRPAAAEHNASATRPQPEPTVGPNTPRSLEPATAPQRIQPATPAPRSQPEPTVIPDTPPAPQPAAPPQRVQRPSSRITSVPATPPPQSPVRVRRAIPVEKSPLEDKAPDAVPEARSNPTERTTVERLPDGRVRTTTTRTVRNSGEDAAMTPTDELPSQPPPERPTKHRFRLFKDNDD
jgi:penicillin-binding protein 1A